MWNEKHSLRTALVLAAATILVPARATADDVHSDDVIIQGKACVGSISCEIDQTFNGDLEVKSGSPDIFLIDVNTGQDDWELDVNNDDLVFKNWVDGGLIVDVVNFGGGAPPNSLVIDPSGDVGIGTSTPGNELHLAFPSPSIRFEDTDDSQTWEIHANSYGFRVGDFTGGTQPLWINSGTGEVGIGTTSPDVTLHVDGEAMIEGDVSVLSSRRAKEILAPVLPGEVLAALEQLPIVTWRYKTDSEGALHMGPTSEAFRAAFGLGADSEHLSLVDTAGVAMASIQALAHLVEAQRHEIAELRTDRRDLVRRIERLESSSTSRR